MNMIDINEMSFNRTDSVFISWFNKRENENEWLKIDKVLE